MRALTNLDVSFYFAIAPILGKLEARLIQNSSVLREIKIKIYMVNIGIYHTLTPKGFRQCFHQKRSKTAMSSTSTKFLKKNFFGHL